MKVEEPFFTLKIRAGLTPEQRMEVNSALCRIAIDPPRSRDELRRVAIRTALAQYEGSVSSRAKMLERQLKSYLSNGWLREQALEVLPEPRSTERVLLHRIAKLNDGQTLGRRQLLRIAGPLRP